MNAPNQPAKRNIFISYRVSDTAGETGRLVDALKNYFEEDQIFMDIDKIEPGVDFADVISRSLDSCDVMLAIIGPKWEGLDANGQSRIKKNDDWVRLELSTALKRNIRVVPVLVDGAVLPDAGELPEDLESLTRRQSYEISNKRWRYDTEQLIGFLQSKIGVRPKRRTPQQPVNVPTGKSGMSIWLKIFLGIFAFVGLLGVIGLIQMAIEKEQPQAQSQVQPLSGSSNNTTTQPVTTDEPVAETQQTQTDINGSWIDPEGGVIAVRQSGNRLNIEVYHNNEQTGTGSGFIENDKVEMSLNMLNVAMVNLNLQLGADGNRMEGSLTAVAGGKTNTINTFLVRANN